MPQYNETFCLKCGRGITSSMPHDLCKDCELELRNPNSSALVDFIAKLQTENGILEAVALEVRIALTYCTIWMSNHDSVTYPFGEEVNAKLKKINGEE